MTLLPELCAQIITECQIKSRLVQTLTGQICVTAGRFSPSALFCTFVLPFAGAFWCLLVPAPFYGYGKFGKCPNPVNFLAPFCTPANRLPFPAFCCLALF